MNMPTQPTLAVFPAPTFPQARENNFIGPLEITMGALIEVPSYPGLQLNDVVTLTMLAFDKDSGDLIDAAGFVQAQVAISNTTGTGFTFFIPRKHFVAICKGHVEARYTVNNGETLFDSLMGTVNINMSRPASGYPSS